MHRSVAGVAGRSPKTSNHWLGRWGYSQIIHVDLGPLKCIEKLRMRLKWIPILGHLVSWRSGISHSYGQIPRGWWRRVVFAPWTTGDSWFRCMNGFSLTKPGFGTRWFSEDSDPGDPTLTSPWVAGRYQARETAGKRSARNILWLRKPAPVCRWFIPLSSDSLQCFRVANA